MRTPLDNILRGIGLPSWSEWQMRTHKDAVNSLISGFVLLLWFLINVSGFYPFCSPLTETLTPLYNLQCIPTGNFKIAVLVFQYLTGQAPAYLADDYQLTSDVSTRRLRSTDTAMCVIRRSNNSFGDRCYAAAGPRLWNTLPVHLRQCDSLGQFKRLLKTHLFGVWDCGALWRLS